MVVRGSSLRGLLAASCALGVIATAEGARAQDTTATTNEVVVTAQKRSENVQNVPEEVTVVSSQFINQLHATQLVDIAAYVPGLQVTTGGVPGETILGLRGIYPIASNVTVATYVDDVPVGGSSLFSNAADFSLDLLPYDVANIQVLSGPQGTLYGATALGGLLKYELTQPDLRSFHGEVGGDIDGVEHAQDVGGGVRATLNGPLLDGQIGFVASYAYESTPGYVDDPQLGQKDENGVRQQGARFGLLVTPAALPKLRVELNALYQQVEAGGLGETALTAGAAEPVIEQLKDDAFVRQNFRKAVDILSDRTTYDLGFADLTSVTSYEYTNLNQVIDGTTELSPVVTGPPFSAPEIPLGPIATSLGLTGASGVAGLGRPAFEDQHIQLSKYTEEVRLASKPSTRFEWLLGAYVTYEHSSLGQVLGVANIDGTATSSYPLAALGGAAVSGSLETFGLPTIYREYAGFGDFTLHITPRLDLAGGVRYSYNAQNYKQTTLLNIAALPNDYGHSNDNVATFSVSPSYKLTHDVNVYLRFASGYQPGGPNVVIPNSTVQVPPTVAADTLTQYEVGLKSQFLNRRITFNVAGFYNNWNDIQVSELDPATATSYLANGGNAKTEGVDASGSYVVIPGLTLGGTFEYVYAAFKDVQPSVTLGAEAGSPLPQTPRFSGSVQANWLHPLVADWSYGLGAALRLEDSRITATNYFSAQANPQAGLYYREPAYGALDLNASVQNARYTLRLFARNVTDTRSYNSYATLPGPQIEGVLIQPRTVGLAVDAKF